MESGQLLILLEIRLLEEEALLSLILDIGMFLTVSVITVPAHFLFLVCAFSVLTPILLWITLTTAPIMKYPAVLIHLEFLFMMLIQIQLQTFMILMI